MLGPKQEAQAALFYEFSLEDHVPNNHLLRSIDRFVDLSSSQNHPLQCDLLRRVVKGLPLQPAAITHRPGLAAMINPPMTQKKSRDQLSLVALIFSGTLACPHQIPDRLMGLIGHPNWRQFARP